MERTLKRLLWVALCTASLTASAQATVSTPPPSVPSDELPKFGLLLDAGFPDVLGLNAVFRPVYFARVNAGVMYNGAGPGLRAGVTVIPFDFAITPTLSFEYGHYFPGNANVTLNQMGVDTTKVEPLLRRLQYDFYDLHLGVEVGSAKRFVFFLRGGLTWLNSTVNGSGEFFQTLANDPTLELSNFNVRGSFPSVKLGFIVYIG